MTINEKYLRGYEPTEFETGIQSLWDEAGFQNPDVCIEKGITQRSSPHFSIVLPPPNITGHLHLGHSLMIAIEDSLVRYHRMKGDRTLWIPGTDHAAIATQSVFEKDIYKREGKSRHDFDRETFFSLIQDFALKNQGYIRDQIKMLGASLDWSREAFTLDSQREKAVRTAFKTMYDKGLIYRKSRVVQWDPKGQTTVSHDEVEYEPTKGKLYTFKYSHDFPLSISTTRPETKVGDTAVAVNPRDQRYAHLIGTTYTIESFAGVPLTIKIIGDDAVEMDYGTGAVGVTPAHSEVDWEMSVRHDLTLIPVINEYGKMTHEAGPLLFDLKTKDARERVVTWLKENNLLESEIEIDINLSKAQRTGGIIEPLPKLQWFIDVQKEFTLEYSEIPGIPSGSTTTLKQILLNSVGTDAITILPERYEKNYAYWSENLRDWCISRQILYGHRIPVWYRDSEIYVGIEAPHGDNWEQDPDTLDTWFSSALWTFSTLGWPDTTDDLSSYHPTTLLNTGDDILPFWVSRMILMSGFLLGKLPFKTVYLHGMVRDEKGRKMSKSLGNGIDPLEMIQKFGTDALRMAMIVAVGPGSPQNLGENKIKAYKHFANKMWNASRYAYQSLPVDYKPVQPSHLREQDRIHLERLNELIGDISLDMENYRLYLASEKLYHYYWHEFADVIIEQSKSVLQNGTSDEKESLYFTLYTIHTTLLKLLHPFMPHITEEIWKDVARYESTELLMITSWPQVISYA